MGICMLIDLGVVINGVEKKYVMMGWKQWKRELQWQVMEVLVNEGKCDVFFVMMFGCMFCIGVSDFVCLFMQQGCKGIN